MMDGVAMVVLRLGLACLVLVANLQVTTSKLADYTTICKAKDPNLQKCLIDSAHQMFQKLEKGIPEFDIPPVDPMAVPRLGLQRSDLGMSLVLSNSTHTGLSGAKIHRASANPDKYQFEFQARLPSYTIVGNYDVNGKVMLLPIKGKGDSNITLYDIDAVWKIQGEPETRDGEKYMKLKEFNVSIQPKNMKVHFNNLFGGNHLLGETMNDLLNTHWKEVYRQLKPALEKAYGEIMFKFGEKIFSKTPYNQIFSDL